MHHRSRPFLLTLMLFALMVRTVIGAPCCSNLAVTVDTPSTVPVQMTYCGDGPDGANAIVHLPAAPDNDAARAWHGGNGGSHGGHGGGEEPDDNRAGPCCSACGSMIPADDAPTPSRVAFAADYTAQFLRDIAARMPAPAYEARGPPSIV